MEHNVSDILVKLGESLEQRKAADPARSYVAGLYDKGLDAILKKIGEESTELVVAAKDGNNRQIIHETADLWFHSLVLLSHAGLNIADVLSELERRYGTSGLDEKARRRFQG
jgi:phosphoribosyl-ATP pyrophosphohydrolase